MRRPRECFELFPERLLLGQMPQPPALEIVAGELADLQQEPQVAALRGHPRTGPLKNFDHALRTLIVVDRREHEQEVGRVGRRFGIVLRRVARARVGTDQRPSVPCKHLSQQASMLRLADRILDESRVAQIDLIGELQPTRVGECPHRPAGCRQRRHHFVEQRVVELGLVDFGPRELGDFLHEALDLALRAFDLRRVDRGGRLGGLARAGGAGVFGGAHFN